MIAKNGDQIKLGLIWKKENIGRTNQLATEAFVLKEMCKFIFSPFHCYS